MKSRQSSQETLAIFTHTYNIELRSCIKVQELSSHKLSGRQGGPGFSQGAFLIPRPHDRAMELEWERFQYSCSHSNQMPTVYHDFSFRRDAPQDTTRQYQGYGHRSRRNMSLCAVAAPDIAKA